jgi:hypothetical protein
MAIMTPQGLKSGQRAVLLRREIAISLSRVLPRRLALLPLGRYISLEFPDMASGGERFRCIARDLIRKPVSTFRDHALRARVDSGRVNRGSRAQ